MVVKIAQHTSFGVSRRGVWKLNSLTDGHAAEIVGSFSGGGGGTMQLDKLVQEHKAHQPPNSAWKGEARWRYFWHLGSLKLYHCDLVDFLVEVGGGIVIAPHANMNQYAPKEDGDNYRIDIAEIYEKLSNVPGADKIQTDLHAVFFREPLYHNQIAQGTKTWITLNVVIRQGANPVCCSGRWLGVFREVVRGVRKDLGC